MGKNYQASDYIRYTLMRALQLTFSHILSDEHYLKILYLARFGKWLNINNPMTFNEKLNWLKLFDHKDLYSIMADKYAVKSYVANIIGDQYVVENYGVYDKWEDIDFRKLPNEFVIKGTHDSGGVLICKNKHDFNFDKAKNKLKKTLKRNYYYNLREWPYKNIKPRIIVDQLLNDHTGCQLRDYKFWCFSGKPTYMYCTIKGDGVYENFYDMDFNIVGINHNFPRHRPEFEKPKTFELMKNLASRLSAGIPFVRVDFFDIEGKVYFGEFTFYDWGGMRPFKDKWDIELGALIQIMN